MAKFYCPSRLSENIRITPEGFLLCIGVPIARTGVMEYGEGETPLEVGDDGLVYVSRSSEEVFRKQTMASFEAKAVTIKHPEDFVDPDNWKDLAKGILQNIRKAPELDDDGEEVLLADMLITDSFAIGLVKAGLREVSCGYEAEYKQTGKGKGKQTSIVGNHCALVEQGRAGTSYAIRDNNRKVATMKEKLKAMLKLIAGGKTVDQALKEVEKTKKKTKKAPTEDAGVKKAEAILARATELLADAKKKAKAKDGGVNPKASVGAGSNSTNAVLDEEKAYDALKSAYDAMGKQLDAMRPAKDESEEEEESEDESEEEEESEDEGDDDSAWEERLKALEAAVAKLLESTDDSEEEEESEDESEEEESEDESEEEEESEDESEEEESEDADVAGEEGSEKKKKTGDAAAAEILAPGLKVSKKANLKVVALKEAIKTKDGKKAVLLLTGGEALDFKCQKTVDRVFKGAARILQLQRGNGLEGTRTGKVEPVTFESFDSKKEDMTPEMMNEANAAHYKLNQQ